jgi:hypothetical protein
MRIKQDGGFQHFLQQLLHTHEEILVGCLVHGSDTVQILSCKRVVFQGEPGVGDAEKSVQYSTSLR